MGTHKTVRRTRPDERRAPPRRHEAKGALPQDSVVIEFCGETGGGREKGRGVCTCQVEQTPNQGFHGMCIWGGEIGERMDSYD